MPLASGATPTNRENHPVPFVPSGGAAFAKSSLSLSARSVHLIFVATIEQHVRRRECLVDEDVFSKASGTHLQRSWRTSAHKFDDP